MYGVQEALAHERCRELRQQAVDRRLRRQAVAARRSRRRPDGSGPAAPRDARSDYELVAR